MESNSFLQSREWGEFQKELGNDVYVFGGTLSYVIRSKLFSYLYVPRGSVDNFIRNQLINKARELSLDYVLIEPDKKFDLQGFVPHSPSIQPTTTLILSLSPDVETLFSSLRKTTRAEIRRAEREHVTVTSRHTLDRWDSFVGLLSETTERQKFFGHSPNYLKKQFEIFAKNNHARLYLAEVNGKIVAGSIVHHGAHTATYLHAASSHEGRKLGAPHMLVWTAIQDAKTHGLSQFDFWGIAPEDAPNHPWAGITIFKKGFGGAVVTYPGSFVFPVNRMKYKLYLLMTFLRTIPAFKAAQRILLSARTRG